jgi:hypothetical protein
MDRPARSKREGRLQYRWPIWFGKDVTHLGFHGLMVDVSSGGIAFMCRTEDCRLHEGQPLTVRFSVPRFDDHDPEGTVGVTRTGQICQVADAGGGTCHVGFQFDTPLSLKPAEEARLSAMCHHGAQ